MNHLLRKRHLRTWITITVLLTVGLLFAIFKN